MSQTVSTVMAFILGTILGSFLNVVIYRLPRNLSIVRPGSRCPHCQTPIRPQDNIPLVSFLVLRRSEERRVGKECRSRWSPDHDNEKKVASRHREGLDRAPTRRH